MRCVVSYGSTSSLRVKLLTIKSSRACLFFSVLLLKVLSTVASSPGTRLYFTLFFSGPGGVGCFGCSSSQHPPTPLKKKGEGGEKRKAKGETKGEREEKQLSKSSLG